MPPQLLDDRKNAIKSAIAVRRRRMDYDKLGFKQTKKDRTKQQNPIYQGLTLKMLPQQHRLEALVFNYQG